jgi:hypothetical protein
MVKNGMLFIIYKEIEKMGAINYGNNEYFNIGMNLNAFDDYTNYDDRQYEYESELEYLIDEIKELLNKYNFQYFTVNYEYGYYEGFYINIDFDYLYLDDHAERLTVLKEITQLKQFLNECCYIGLVKYSPGWCTAYYSEQETKQAIKQAIKEMKQNFIHYPTYKTYRIGA